MRLGLLKVGLDTRRTFFETRAMQNTFEISFVVRVTNSRSSAGNTLSRFAPLGVTRLFHAPTVAHFAIEACVPYGVGESARFAKCDAKSDRNCKPNGGAGWAVTTAADGTVFTLFHTIFTRALAYANHQVDVCELGYSGLVDTTARPDVF